MPKAIKYFVNVLLLISCFICGVSFRNKLVITFYLQVISDMNYDVFQLQEGFLYFLITKINKTYLKLRFISNFMIVNSQEDERLYW